MKKTKVSKERKKISRKRTILNFALVGIIGIGSGIFLGSWYSFTILSSTPPVDYGSYSEAELRDNPLDAIKSATKNNNLSESDKQNWVQIAKQKGTSPQNLTVAENVLLAEYNLQQASSYTAIGVGKVDTSIAGVSQSVYSGKHFDGNTYMFESISKGMLTVANCLVMNKNDSSVLSIKGKDATTTSASWTGAKSTITDTECKEKNGGTPDMINPYIISSKTIKTASSITKSSNNNKNLYSFTLTLDPITSVLNYVKQVKQTSGLSEFPKFFDVTIKIVLDENWNFVEFNVVENYQIKYSSFLTPSCKGFLDIKFTINEPVTLPQYSN